MSLGMQLGLSHSQNPFNIMKQGGVVHNSNSNQRVIMLQQQNNLNKVRGEKRCVSKFGRSENI